VAAPFFEIEISIPAVPVFLELSHQVGTLIALQVHRVLFDKMDLVLVVQTTVAGGLQNREEEGIVDDGLDRDVLALILLLELPLSRVQQFD
jgi:hypothetical protein